MQSEKPTHGRIKEVSNLLVKQYCNIIVQDSTKYVCQTSVENVDSPDTMYLSKVNSPPRV